MVSKRMAILVLLLALPLLAFAQDQSGGQGAGGDQAMGQQGGAGDQAGAAGSDGAGESEAGAVTERGSSLEPFSAGLYRLSEGVDVAISNESGDVTGQVRDIVIDRNGEMRFVVASISQGAQAPAAGADQGAAGQAPDVAAETDMGESAYLVPMERVTFDAAEGEFRFDIAADEIADLMRMENGNMPAGVSGGTGEETAPSAAATAEQPAPGSAQLSERFVFVSSLLGSEFTNLQGEDLGRVEDVVLNIPQTRVEYMAVSTAGGLGLGERYYALPMRVFIDADMLAQRVVFDVRQEDFRDSPGFLPAGAWPGAGDATFGIVGDDDSDDDDNGANGGTEAESPENGGGEEDAGDDGAADTP